MRAEGTKSIVLFCLVWCGLASPAAGCLSDGRYVMGTVLEITLCAADPLQGQRAFAPLFATASRLDSLLTTFSPDSPISHLNARAGQGAQPIPPEVAGILALSLRYWRLTGGTFDVTVGPLVTLWRQAAAGHAPPSSAAVRQARTQTGSEKVQLSPDGRVSLRHAGMAIDLGGIGKGYALDALVGQLKEYGIENALLDFGQSSIWALGAPPDAPGWRLLVQQPRGSSAGMITLRDQALSVSASLGQSVIVNGQRYGHVIDPRSGEPLRRDVLACVLAPTAAQAEALSKTLLILGEQEGIAFLQRLPGVEGLLVEASGQRWMTTGWAQATAFAPVSATW